MHNVYACTSIALVWAWAFYTDYTFKMLLSNHNASINAIYCHGNPYKKLSTYA